MSDFEKVKAYAREYSQGRAINLRWEAAGDARHPQALLGRLFDENVPFYAEVNVFEPEGHDNYSLAYYNLQNFIEAEYGEDYVVVLNSSMNATRRHRSGGREMDFIFVRNVMPTDNSFDKSCTYQADRLNTIHQRAMKNRRLSLRYGGVLRVGMSGMPGLIKDDNRQRLAASGRKNQLFNQYKKIRNLGRDSGLSESTGIDFDRSVEPMRNNGTTIERKTTYYLTFVRPFPV